jgi:hypothetical protein
VEFVGIENKEEIEQFPSLEPINTIFTTCESLQKAAENHDLHVNELARFYF